MSELPEKAPVKHEHIVERSSTVDGLFDDTIRGANKSEKPWTVTELNSFSGDSWNKFYSVAKQSLQSHAVKDDSAEQTARSLAMSQQLEALNRSGDRAALIQKLIHNDGELGVMHESAGRVQNALRTGNLSAARELQNGVIKAADALNHNALSFELSCLKSARKKSGSPKVSAELDRSEEDLRVLMASAFVERVRQAAFLSAEKKPYQAEKMLQEAMHTQIPSQCMESGFVKDLQKNAGKQLSSLRVENNLLDLYDGNLAKFDITGKDGIVSLDQINAARSKSTDEGFTALADFLSSHYNYLVGKHFNIFGKDGIRRSDIVEYEKERSSKINDMKL